MINKLIVGRYLNLPRFGAEKPTTVKQDLPRDFVLVADKTYSIQESSHQGTFGSRTRVSQVTSGAHESKAHRTFRWLPWLPGKVSCIRLAGSEILTGPMSGCWLTTFTYKGQRYAGHIGTEDSPVSKRTRAAKAAWRDAMADYSITCHNAGNPVAPAVVPNPAGLIAVGEMGVNFYGAWDGHGQVYSVGLTNAGNTGRRIAAVTRIPRLLDVTGF